MYYVVVDVGCIECGEESSVLGIFENEEMAENVRNDHALEQAKNWQGEHRFLIAEIDAINKVYEVKY